MSAGRKIFFLALCGFGRMLRLALICITCGLTAVLSVSIYSSERTKSAEFDARQAEAVMRQHELDLMRKRQEVELARLDFEKQNQRNIGGGGDYRPRKKAGR